MSIWKNLLRILKFGISFCWAQTNHVRSLRRSRVLRNHSGGPTNPCQCSKTVCCCQVVFLCSKTVCCCQERNKTVWNVNLDKTCGFLCRTSCFGFVYEAFVGPPEWFLSTLDPRKLRTWLVCAQQNEIPNFKFFNIRFKFSLDCKYPWFRYGFKGQFSQLPTKYQDIATNLEEFVKR